MKIEYDRTPVENRGDPLGEILWRGRQWAVTHDGLEALDGCYFIAPGRIVEGGDHGWAEHMQQKNWVDLDDFCTAWLVAAALFGSHAAYLRAAIGRAQKAKANAESR